MQLQLRLFDVAHAADIHRIAPGCDAAVVRCVCLRTDDKINPPDIGAHDLRHLHHAEIRQAKARLALAHGIKNRLHRDIFDKQRHHAQHR